MQTKRKNLMTEEACRINEKARQLSAELKKLLHDNKKSISAAESCTGGLVAKLFTDIPGSSEYFMGGVVSYTNQVKMDFLGVKKETLAQYTEVSRQTAAEMAEGIRAGMKTSFGVSTTGIAGPGGAMPGKPVGTVYFGISEEGKQTKTFHMLFQGDRDTVRAQAALFVLEKVKEALS